MASKIDTDNPFLALFTPSNIPIPKTPEVSASETEEKSTQFNDLVEKIFKLTLNSQKKSKLFYMKDLAEALKQELFDENSLDQAVLDFIVSTDDSLVDYLFRSYESLPSIKQQAEYKTFKQTILTNLHLAFTQPELFPSQRIPQDFVRTFSSPDENLLKNFLSDFTHFISAQETSVTDIFTAVFEHLKHLLTSENILIGSRESYNTMLIMSSIPLLAKAMVSSSILDETRPRRGVDCEKTLLGSLFVSSCISRTPGVSDFFDKPSQSPVTVHQTVESNIWSALEAKTTVIHKIFYNLLKVSPEVSGLTRAWIGKIVSTFQI